MGDDRGQQAEKAEVPAVSAATEYIRISRGKYVLLFFIMFLLLSLFDLEVENETDYGLARVERLWNGNNIFSNTRVWDEGQQELAKKLQMRPEEVQITHHVVEAYLNSLEKQPHGVWSRLISFRFGDYRLFIGGNIVLNFLFAFFIAMGYYVRERVSLAQELIDYQHRRYQRLDEQLEARMAEISKVLEKFDTLQGKLVEAEKLASIGRLSATLAHEIRNPLSIIKSSTDIVMDDVGPNTGTAAAVGLIRDEVNRMDRIITDLLNFARPKRPNLAVHDLLSLVRHWLPPVVEELEKHRIQLVPQLEKVNGDVLVDADQLYQVFLNVMWNARDALIGVGNPHIFVLIEDGGEDYLNLVIQDTGPGMLPEVLRQIKEPFFSTKAQGTGLGVPVSVQLIEGMGGQFEVESELEFGTTVTIMLARASSRPPMDSVESQMDQHLKEVLAQSVGGGTTTSAPETETEER